MGFGKIGACLDGLLKLELSFSQPPGPGLEVPEPIEGIRVVGVQTDVDLDLGGAVKAVAMGKRVLDLGLASRG